jgi:hypothetical protein
MPKWLLDPEGPVRVRPASMPRLLPWFLRLLAASSPSRLKQLEAAGAALCSRVCDDLSRFRLAAGVMSADNARADRVGAALRAGIVWINCSQPTFTETPWGGYKLSGIGRELGRWGLEAKQVTRFVSDDPWAWYLK